MPSTVPLPPAFFYAILCLLKQAPEGIRRRDIHEPVADLMGLTAAERAERPPSGAHFRYRHRIGWSLNMLKSAGYIESPMVGIWRITPQGRDILAANPQQFSVATLKGIARKARAATRNDVTEDPSAEQVGSTSQQTPEERIEGAISEIEGAVASELLERMTQAGPAFFEGLVLELLHALGYGTSVTDLRHLGGSGDGGIDGVISLDKLGFEKVYVQAKRWQGSVGRPDVQAFFGALAGRRAKRGVFITTSNFTKEARDFGVQVSENVVLIDGTRLTSLMIENGVGVTHYRVVRIPRVDGDYFE
jgi:restriction system protein